MSKMDCRTALALAIVAVEELAEIDPDADWHAARRELVKLLREQRQLASSRPGAGVYSTTLKHWRGIEEEFGEPVADVIQGMRDQGATWHTVAGALGIAIYTLNNWRRLLGLPINSRDRLWDSLSYEAFEANGGGGYGRWHGKNGQNGKVT